MTARDTIFALSTGAGRAAIAVIRMSGPLVSGLLTALSGGLPPPRSFALRTIQDPATGEILDKAILAWLPGPHSFTGEDCAEFHLHASPAVVAAVMAVLSSHPGVRPAEAGEFTQRAFLNGKMDLVEVEGLSDLLVARTAGQRRQAFRQMSGSASSVFDDWRQQLVLIRADIEATVDFADEPGVAEAAAEGIDHRIKALIADMSRTLDASGASEVIRDGVRVVLAGHPNTGKSSLLNHLARRDAAIVSDVPGTTRDVIEVSLEIGGIPVTLFDTAGLRAEASDEVEAEGIRRSRHRIAEADLVIWVWSADVPGSALQDGWRADLVIRNKCDIEVRCAEGEGWAISTRTGEGVNAFLERLKLLLSDRFGTIESALLVSTRQKTAVVDSIRHLNNALSGDGLHSELKAEEVRRASDEIGRLVGRVGVEEWLGAIFSRFCIGK